MSFIQAHRSEGETEGEGDRGTRRRGDAAGFGSWASSRSCHITGREGDRGTRRRGDGVVFRPIAPLPTCRVVYGLLFIVYCLLFPACQPAPPPTLPPLTPSLPPITLHIGLDEGAAAISPLLTSPPVAVEWVIANNATLLEDLNAGQVDAILTHVIPPGDEHWFNPVALDGLVVLVHPDNPVTELTLAEIQAIFSGKIGNWSAVGGTDSPIALVSRERGQGARAIFNERVLGAQRLAITALVVPEQAGAMEAVAENAAAIGYGMMSGMTDGVRPLILDGYAPTPGNTASQNYPLTVPLYFLAPTPAEPQGELRAFLAWLQSPATQTLLGEKIGRVR